MNSTIMAECQPTEVVEGTHGRKSYTLSVDSFYHWALKRAQAGANIKGGDLEAASQAIRLCGYDNSLVIYNKIRASHYLYRF